MHTQPPITLSLPAAHAAALCLLRLCARATQQYVPLFLTKEDLDVAVGGAHRQRNAAQISAVNDKAAAAEEEYTAALKEVRQQSCGASERAWCTVSRRACVVMHRHIWHAAGARPVQPRLPAVAAAARTPRSSPQVTSAAGRDKAALEAKASKAKARLDDARGKARAVEAAALPKVEVGSFEEVLLRMSASEGSELAAWSQVMFVAPGLLQQAGAGGRALEGAAAASGGGKKK